MESIDKLFIILDDCINWNDKTNEPVSHDSDLEKIKNCIDESTNLMYIHPEYNLTPLLYGLFLRLHPDIIRLLASKGYDLNLKLEWNDYIFDDYIEIDYNIKQIASIKNFILAAYYASIGEHIEEHLVEMFTERDYVLNIIHYPLDISDYINYDYTFEKLENGRILWHPIEYALPNLSFIESELDTEFHNMSIYDSISGLGLNDYVKKKYEITEYDKQVSGWVKDYCKIFNFDYNTISSWKIDTPDDFKTITK